MRTKATRKRYSVWAYHQRVKRWVPLVENLSGEEAVNEAAVRADRVRRSGQPCRFRVLPEGEAPS